MQASFTNASQHRSFLLAGSTIEPPLNQISRNGQQVQVERRVMLLLLCLVENVDQVVTREALLARLWHNKVPNDEALTQAVSKLRKALGDSAKSGQVIQTVRKVGYRLKGPVSPAGGANSGKGTNRPSLKRSRKKWMWVKWVAMTGMGIVFLSNIVTVRTFNADEPHSDRATGMRLILTSDHKEPPADLNPWIDPEELEKID